MTRFAEAEGITIIREFVEAETGKEWVQEEQAPLPQSALASSRRGGRSLSTHSASLAGYSGGQVINFGEESS